MPSSTAGELVRAGALSDGGLALWSMWDGYLKAASGQRFSNTLVEAGVPLGTLHTSGHATPAGIKRLVDAIDPATVVPIHTESPENFTALSDRVTVRNDGEWWSP